MVENVSPAQAWAALKSDPNAQLVDVRTDAEWNLVGVPDLIEAGKQAVLLQWQTYPAMAAQPAISGSAEGGRLRPGPPPVFHLPNRRPQPGRRPRCRGRRNFPTPSTSRTFEGPPDSAGHRGARSGWKAARLPWRQKWRQEPANARYRTPSVARRQRSVV